MTSDEETRLTGATAAPLAPRTAGGRIPALQLPRVGSDQPVDLRGDGRNPSMIFFAHSPGCAGCRAYVAALLEHPDAFTVWGGRLLVILPGEASEENEYPTAAPFPVYLLVDETDSLAQRCGVQKAALLVADAWGEVHFSISAGEGHDLPTPGEVEEWLKFLAIQCPECESPEGLWRTL